MNVGELASLSLDCERRFDELYEAIEATDAVSEFRPSLPDLEDELGRFRLWAGNIGALKTGRASLDYRLRDAAYLSQNAKSLLEGLTESLTEG